MKALVGLGNPGKKYEHTRHNVGFLFVDWLLSELGEEVVWKEKFRGHFSQQGMWGEKVFFLKPQTYMNLSGSSVRSLVDFYKIDLQDLLIISDDVDMEFGKVRLRSEGRAGGHNGLIDIFSHLDTSDISRLKIGIGRHPHMPTSDWVLSKLSDEEVEQLHDDIFPEARTIIQEKFFSQT